MLTSKRHAGRISTSDAPAGRPLRCGADVGRTFRSGIFVFVALALLGGCSDLRVKIGVFDSVDEARAAGAVAAGWVPDGLPADASDLREGHLPDGRYWGVFSFPRADDAAIRALLRDEITSGTLSCDPPGRLEWWPRLLWSPVDVEKVRTTGFRLYHGADGRTFVVNWGQGRAYYWRA
jgi:hypothetical protein